MHSSPDLSFLLDGAVAGRLPAADEARLLGECTDLAPLMSAAAAIRDAACGDRITYSRKVFVPLTRLCRDRCGYCSFAKLPQPGEKVFLEPAEVLDIAEAGRRAGCKEALFTLGDRPEARHPEAREALARLGHDSTLGYLEAMAKQVLERTGLLPHLNPGVMTGEDLRRMRPVCVSMGLMLESTAQRLSRRGGPHAGCPDKQPAVRLAAIAAAGEAAIPYTSGILVGIGETRQERIDALLELRALHERYGHIQEVIVQNFRAKPGTAMAGAPEPSFEEHLWTVAVARILFGATSSIQAPPNLSAGARMRLIEAGIDDWGGVSPVTRDHVNPEAPWPQIELLAQETARAGKVLVERLAAHPPYLEAADRWLAPEVEKRALPLMDAACHARSTAWAPGSTVPPRPEPRHLSERRATPARSMLEHVLEKACCGREPSEAEIVALFDARDADFWRVCRAADALRREVNGDTVGYVVNRNITYTNLCKYRCRFCAFSKGKANDSLRGRPYEFDCSEIARRAAEARARGATEVCIQGGIHPSYDGRHYLDIVAAVKAAVPDLHIHAFSPLEIRHGAASLGIGVREFLGELKRAGLGSLPGTAAEILDDEVRRVICPDKLSTEEWLRVVETAHELGLPTTATIMFGHVERPMHWARHLLHLRRLQARSGGFTEFVPLPFVAEQAPLFLRGGSRAGPTLRESLLMHAVARLVLHPMVRNIQASWVKMGRAGVALCLAAGANDYGGTLMGESISRAAGAAHGEELTPEEIEADVRAAGRLPRRRTTLYGEVSAGRCDRATEHHRVRCEPA
ncbi:MAG: 5-amino-6-(D-ribitylamino)uracil--L-tyrosine 4-hydroxyphenyl transferase CofH [Burkholderiales bacterium]|nr:5-amino-6-(D-ribitylamino)uracil--L-tyrosine 4-hydroxyphenyl transferase CofH [Burkholderiales bacterium]OJX04644.1 MAG: 7,8-didemethyl-8-hydroxy-5-deazariboflavin synthase [Burkholderiales bacterium 70-64]